MSLGAKAWMSLVAGVLLLTALALLDFVAPTGTWYGEHPNLDTAVSTAITFVAAGLLLNSFVQERELRRLRTIAVIAFRSLAQHANDAGRSLLAPLNGADLYVLGIPEAGPRDAEQNRQRLARAHLPSTFEETTGTWHRYDRNTLNNNLQVLSDDQEFLRQLYRTTAVMRRRLQEVTALWAPTMFVSAEYQKSLAELRRLTDDLERLQEWLRPALADDATKLDSTWRSNLTRQFWVTIDSYEAVRDRLADGAELPSEGRIVSRKG